MKKPKLRWIWAAPLFLAFIGTVVVLRRSLMLTQVLQGTYEPPPMPPGFPPFPEDGFKNNILLTFLHILPGLLFVTLGLLQFSKRIRTKHLNFHRWNGRALMIIGIVIGVSGIVMGFRMAISGISETAATTFFGTFFLFALAKAYLHIRNQNSVLHREWMIRAFAIGLSVTTTRPIVGIFMGTSPFTGLRPEDFFGTALWIGFTLHLIIAEAWINKTRRWI